MGKGGYNGGSTILGPWSSGWFSKPKGKVVKRTPAELEEAAERRLQRSAEKLAKATARQAAEKAKAAAKRSAAEAADRERRRVASLPRTRKTPEQIAARLGRAMQGVEVVRRTSNTLRARKPDGD